MVATSVTPDLNGWKHARFIVTAYVVNPREFGKCMIYTNHTSTNTRAWLGTIAVDPRVIAYGTRLYVRGYGFGVASDSGGAIIGHRLDLAMLSCDKAIEWGRRPVLVAYSR